MTDPGQLAERLQRLAERTAPTPREDLAERIAVRHRAQRRQRLGTGLVAAVVAAVVVAVPQLLDRSPSATPAPAAPAAPTEDPPAVDVLGLPTRGSLAQDAAFVDGVRQLSWAESDDPDAPTVADPPVETRHVVFAGDVPGARWALVTGQAEAGLAAAWFAGPAAAAPEQLRLVSVLFSGGGPSTTLALSDAATGALVVVAAPGDEVEVSPRPEVAADGTIGRTWQRVEAPDGVAALQLSPATFVQDEALRYRVTRDGTHVVTMLPAGYRRFAGGYDPPDPSVTWLRAPATALAPDDVVASTASDVLVRAGLSPDEAPFTGLAALDVPAPGGRPTGVHLLTATLPSGATYTEARLARQVDGRVNGGPWCGSELRPAGRPVAEQTFAVVCDVADVEVTDETVRSLVVVAPEAAQRAEALDADGRVLAGFPVVDGAAVVDAPEGVAAVRALSADGAVLGEAPLMGSVDWDAG